MDAVDLLVRIAVWSSQLVWVVWLGTAVWFAAVRHDSVGGKVKHFFGTLLPEPWMIVGIVILVVAMSFVPRRVWDPVSWDVRPMLALGAVVIIAGSVLMVWARLIATFGQRYEEYRAAVPALLPLAKR